MSAQRLESNRDHPTVPVLGIQVSAIDILMALAIFDDWIASDKRRYACITGVHGIIESQGEPELREIHNRAGMVTPDGMPLVWVGRYYGHRQMRRVYGPDLLLAVCAHSLQKGYRHFFYGGAEGVPERLASRLQERFPGLEIVGCYSPPFRPLTTEEDQEVIDRINYSGADFVWVGLSTPKQERWMAEHVEKLNASVLVGVGAAFDFHAGLKPQAPKWMQRSGLEWFFRLITEPKRLWKRYLFNNPRFIIQIFLQILGFRKDSFGNYQ